MWPRAIPQKVQQQETETDLKLGDRGGLQVLENCKHDRMPHVRTAVCEALHTAKMFMTGETINEDDDEDQQGSVSLDPTKETPQRRNWSSNKYSPSSQDTYNLSSYTPPPTVSDSATSDPFSTPQFGSTGRMKRSLLFSSKADSYSPPVPAPCPTAALTGYHESAGLTSYHDSRVAKDIARSSVPGGSTVSSRGGVLGYHDAAPPCENKLVCEKETEGPQQNDKESLEEKDLTPVNVTQEHPKGKVESRFSPFEALITRSFGEAEGDLMAEDEEILSRGTAELGLAGRNGASIRGNSRLSNVVGKFRQDSQTPESVVADSECVQSNSISCRGMDSGHSDVNDSALHGKKGFGRNSVTEKVVDVLESKQISHMGSLQGLPGGKPNVHDFDAGISHAQYMKLANLSNNPEDGFSALKPRVLITTADFLPYTTPRRLVLSLQSQLSSPGNEGDEVGNEDVVRRIDEKAGKRAESSEDASRRIDDGTGKRIDFNEEADMDVESSSDSGWSVRDNPIASDESVTEDSEEEMEERHTEIYETFALPRKVQSVAGLTPRRKAVSPPREQVKFLDRDDDSDHSRNPESVEHGSLEGSILPHQISKLPGTPERSPRAGIACTSCSESQRKRSAMKAQEWDLGMNVNRAAGDHLIGTRRSMLFEQEAEASSDTSQGSKSSANDPADDAVWAGEGEPQGWWSNLSLVRSAKNSCSRISSIAEAVLGGSLCVVIAVPVTMVLARVLHTPQDYFLVPT
ncbi:hypothetical protein KC19_10G025600 [Ceratodon purpureus]|uniref:Uncharacterized protein n=1 Tax=Ceratodon purpureus TaxID=3225 RepID=A0A8T0GGG1_CERPU|nr:hypothetical protein KC19_10G025600 [Ceratodon purpureus]